MTQAFNLSQFANNVNTSGQASLTTGVIGTLPVANGGTGLTSPGASGNVLQSNGSSWQSNTVAFWNGSHGQVFTSSGTFTIPSGITSIKVTIVGGGGGASTWYGAGPGYYGNGASGNSSVVSSGTQSITTITATGGGGGVSNNSPGAGGTATNGDLNISGSQGTRSFPGMIISDTFERKTLFSQGGASIFGLPSDPYNVSGGTASGYGTGGSPGLSPTDWVSLGVGGGSGACAIKFLSGLTPGNTLNVIVGTGGAGSTQAYFSGQSGANGVVIFEW